jgi:hypothetical protein
MNIVLDTSAVNRLHADEACRELLLACESVGVFHVTALNILEVARTTDTAKRQALLRFLFRLWRQRGPLAMPNTMLRALASAFLDGRTRTSIGGLAEDFDLAELLYHPERADDTVRQQINAWAIRLEQGFRAAHEESRRAALELFRANPPSSASAFLHWVVQERELAERLVPLLVEASLGHRLDPSRAHELLAVFPQWRLFMLGWAQSVYSRVVQSERYGHNTNPGSLDLWCAAYLPVCDWFVTFDMPQWAALRLLQPFAGPGHRVFRYDHLRARLLPPTLSAA